MNNAYCKAFGLSQMSPCGSPESAQVLERLRVIQARGLQARNEEKRTFRGDRLTHGKDGIQGGSPASRGAEE